MTNIQVLSSWALPGLVHSANVPRRPFWAAGDRILVFLDARDDASREDDRRYPRASNSPVAKIQALVHKKVEQFENAPFECVAAPFAKSQVLYRLIMTVTQASPTCYKRRAASGATKLIGTSEWTNWLGVNHLVVAPAKGVSTNAMGWVMQYNTDRWTTLYFKNKQKKKLMYLFTTNKLIHCQVSHFFLWMASYKQKKILGSYL